MDLHASIYKGRTAVLFVDSLERIGVLPTDFINTLSRSPRRFSEGTLTTYSATLKDFLNALERDDLLPKGFAIDDRIRSLDLSAVDNYLKALQCAGKSPSSVRLADVVIKRFTDWLVTEEAGRVYEEPLYLDGKYRTPPPPRRMPKYLTVPQVIQLISGLNYEYQRLTAHVLFDTGARVSEIPRILTIDIPKLEHYPQTQNYFPLLIRGSKGQGEQIKERYSMVSRPVLIRISRYHKSNRFLRYADITDKAQPAFLNFEGKLLKKKAIQQFVSRARIKTGMPKGHPHMFRHSTAYSILRSEHGKSYLDNLVVLQRVLGHSDISTTEIYTHIPAPVLQRVREFEGRQEMLFRFEEAQKILDGTYLRRRDEPKAGS